MKYKFRLSQATTFLGWLHLYLVEYPEPSLKYSLMFEIYCKILKLSEKPKLKRGVGVLQKFTNSEVEALRIVINEFPLPTYLSYFEFELTRYQQKRTIVVPG